MRFGRVSLDEAEGAILAHSLALAGGKLKKGVVLGPAEVARLRQEGIAQVVAARLGPDDVPEDEAAARLGAALAPCPAALGLTASAPFTGRMNLYATGTGIVEIDAALVAELNAVDEAVTLATLPDRARVTARQMVATIKIIPYAAPAPAVARAEAILAGAEPAIRVHPVRRRTAALILTQVPGMKPALLGKGAEPVRARLRALGIELVAETVVAHEEEALARALAEAPGEMVLILTASATSDRRDVGPAGLVTAGGTLTRFGMPVDPGNLLFLGSLAERPVIGLPGCARSPKLNGVDWVLERVACGLDPSAAEIAAMGVGGLLKEIPSRPAPRTGEAEAAHRPRIAAVILAAGQSSRMGGRDKLLEEARDGPLLAHVARAVTASGVDETVVVLRAGDAERRAALAGLDLRTVDNARAADGMGTSIAAGVSALGSGAEGVLIVPGDMPDLRPGDFDRLIAAFDPEEGRTIIRAVSEEGRPGHPVLFGRRFFEPLRAIEGDQGARAVIEENPDFVVEVKLAGRAAVTDLDTPEDWDAWRRASGGGA